MRVPLVDLSRQVAALRPELTAAVDRVLRSTQFILGPEVAAFEQEMAAYLGVRHAIGVASGTDALFLALRATGIGPGDRVLTSAFTFFATASAILNAGAEPVFADIDPATYGLSPETVRAVLAGHSTPHRRLGVEPDTIRAVLPVHLYGQPVAAHQLTLLAERHGLLMIEDAAQALGAAYRGHKVGTLGHLAAFSFFPTKSLGGFGDGGLVTTDDDALADRVRLLRVHGARPRYHHHLVGTNSRLDALQAALLRVKLPHLEGWVTARRGHAAAYTRYLATTNRLTVPITLHDRFHCFHQYTVRVGDGRRAGMRDHLRRRGIETAVYYPVPLHLQPVLRHLGYRPGDLPEAERACQEVVSLPMFPELRDEERSAVVAAVHEALATEPVR